MKKYIKLSKYAEKMGVTYQTAWSWYKFGKIENTMKTPSGSIFVLDDEEDKNKENIKNKNNGIEI